MGQSGLIIMDYGVTHMFTSILKIMGTLMILSNIYSPIYNLRLDTFFTHVNKNDGRACAALGRCRQNVSLFSFLPFLLFFQMGPYKHGFIHPC